MRKPIKLVSTLLPWPHLHKLDKTSTPTRLIQFTKSVWGLSGEVQLAMDYIDHHTMFSSLLPIRKRTYG